MFSKIDRHRRLHVHLQTIQKISLNMTQKLPHISLFIYPKEISTNDKKKLPKSTNLAECIYLQTTRKTYIKMTYLIFKPPLNVTETLLKKALLVDFELP